MTLKRLIFKAVPRTGIEPALPCGNQILSLARLPIPPSGQLVIGTAKVKLYFQSATYFFKIITGTNSNLSAAIQILLCIHSFHP